VKNVNTFETITFLGIEQNRVRNLRKVFIFSLNIFVQVPQAGHVITGDLKIINNTSRKYSSKGLNIVSLNS
jgi:hypothetical protein